jgi:glycosyltransferase involved in cell wall biosynthesis
MVAKNVCYEGWSLKVASTHCRKAHQVQNSNALLKEPTCTLRGIPTIASMNTSLWGGLTDAFKRVGISIGVPEFMERLTLKATMRVLAATKADAESKALEMDIDREHFVVVPDAIDINQFSPRETPHQAIAKFRLTHKIPADARVVLYLGRISLEKGWNDLSWFVKHPSSERIFLLVCGDGPDRRKLELQLCSLELPDKWCITGFLSPENVRVALQASDVLVLPSRREVFGGVLLEAMASELPAVAYKVGGIGEVAGDPQAVLLVEGGAKADLVEAVLKVIESDTIRFELINRGKRRVWDFSIEKVADLTLAVYFSVARPLAEADRLELHSP